MTSIDNYDYDLPSELIAQHPVAQRDQSRLLHIHRTSGELFHQQFTDLPDLLQPEDLLILNNTKVVPARLFGERAETGGKWEGLYLRSTAEGYWELMCQTRGHPRSGEVILISGSQSPLRLRLIEQKDGKWLAAPESEIPTFELLDLYGKIPLPPYIRKGEAQEDDLSRYQTLYAQQAGAVAAPTAGLHFTEEIFARLKQRGIHHAFVTLHVGAGTFQPVKVEDITQHQMHQEWGEISLETVQAIAQCRERKGRLIAVGTTSVRVLESVAAKGPIQPWSGDTSLFIYPPYQFQAIDGMITNFHLPRSTLLMMVAAFMGMDLMRQAYEIAIAQQYRFYSYGDAMLIL